jgi:hypothetical protein
MAKSIGQMKEKTSIFRTYLNKEKFNVSQAYIGLVDARLIGVFLQAGPNLTFRDDLKQALMDVMVDGTPISIFPKRIKEPSNDSSTIRFTNGLAFQVAIPDRKKAAEYTETLTKEMEYFNGNDSFQILSLKFFLPFGKQRQYTMGPFENQSACKTNIYKKFATLKFATYATLTKKFQWDTTQQVKSSTPRSDKCSWMRSTLKESQCSHL